MMSSTPISADVLGLFGDRDQTPVDRAIAEIRAGRAVLLEQGDHVCVLLPAESASTALLASLRGLAGKEPALILSAARLRALGVAGSDRPMALRSAALTAERIDDLVRQPGAALREQLEEVPAAAESALLLLRLALLLPAALLAAVPADRVAGLGAASVTAEAIAAYADAHQGHVRLVSRAPVPLFTARKAEFVVFRGGEGLREQIAIIVGEPDPTEPVLTRLHSACLTGDLFGSLRCDCGDQLRGAVKAMAERGGGVLLYLDQEGRGNGIANKISAYRLQHEGLDTYEADEVLGLEDDNRHFAFAAEMLRQLGFSRLALMTNNPGKAAALTAAGIEVSRTERVYGRLSRENIGYLEAKRDRGGHLVNPQSLLDTLIEAAE